MKRNRSLQRIVALGIMLTPAALGAREALLHSPKTETLLTEKNARAEEGKPDAAAKPNEEPAPLSPEIRLMQEIEPGFIPKDERAVQLFMLQKVVRENEEAIKAKKELRLQIRTLFSKKFRENLEQYSDKKLGDVELRFNRSLEDSITSYEHALKYNPHHAMTPDALYFLGLSYFEVDEKIYFEKLAAYSAAREQGREDVEYPEENFGRTIGVYERLIRDYPNYRHMESVYYLLGLALWYEGDFYNSVERFQELITNFPKSKYVEEVWFRLGEYFYDMDEYQEALDAYARVMKNPKSPLYDKAVYKSAWAYFQDNRYDKAIERFSELVELTDKEKSQTMRAEAIRYIVKSFGEKLYLESGIAKPKAVRAKKKEAKTQTKTKPKTETKTQAPKLSDAEREYAEKVGLKLAKRVIAHFKAKEKIPEYFRELLFELASQLLDELKTEGAILALRAIIELDPRHKDNPRIYSQIVDILNDANRLEAAREENQALIDRFNKNSAWYRSMANDVEARLLAREAVRDALLALAVYHHKQGKDQKDAHPQDAQENFKKAARLYVRYVKEYPERDDTHKALFYFAESAFELGRFKLALEAYQLLIDYPLPMPDNFRREAIYNIVFTYRHVLEVEAKSNRFKEVDFDALTSKQRGLEQQEIPPIGLKYLAAIDDFLKIAPADPQVPVLLFHAAALYYVYGHADEAIRRFFFIIETYPTTAAASVSARLVLDDAIAREDWTRVVELSRQFQAQNLGGKTEEFQRIEGNARFKMARKVFEDANELQKNNQLAEAKAKYRESAELFAVLLREDPKNPYADVMLFNSARAIAQSGAMTAAIPLYREVYTKYPKSDYAKTARFQEALALEKMLKFNEAAVAYDGIIKEDPQSEAAGDAMLNKALLFEAAGNLNSAIDAFVVFAKKYPDRVEAPDALLTAAALSKKQGKISQQIAMLEQFIRQYQKDPSKTPAIIEAHVHIADTYGDLARAAKAPAEINRNQKAQLTHYQSAVRLYSSELNSPLAAFYAAKAQLFLEKPEQDSFKKLAINARTGKAQGEQLTAMMKKLTELAAKNEAIIKVYAQAVSNAESLYRIGALYEHLARSMLKAPCPNDVAAIDDFACDEYLVLLEDKAAILEEKSLSAYVQAYDIAMGAYDTPPELVTRIQTALNRLKPGKYQRVGNVIEKPVKGAFYGQGRMLSTGNMASQLHEAEVDPDIKKIEVPVKSEEPAKTPTNSEEEAPKEKIQEEVPKEGNDALEEEDFE